MPYSALLAVAAAVGILCACGCTPAGDTVAPKPGNDAAPTPDNGVAPPAAAKVEAKIETSMGDMVVELYADKTPNTVTNFVYLAAKGFYDGLVFHRVIDGFMIQGGCPNGTGRGGPGYEFADEFVPELKHSGAGILSMANAGANTNGSQFFITLKATPHLDGHHSVFGKVTEGMDILAKIGHVETDANDRPLTPVVIKKVTILRDGKPVTGDQPVPKTL